VTRRQGQANHFLRAAAEKIPYGIQRYVGEAERLYGILDARLSDRDYVAGPGRGKYSIADISLVGWVNVSNFSGLDLAGQFPHVNAWLDRLLARPAVQRGLAVPGGSVSRIANGNLEKEKWDEGRQIAEEAKKKYGYKYASP
jgi:glutathione S-transferase